ncbi:hypothetical protein L873DRAFT_1799578 [Choiromyces venosus 120613-1]|uniref:Uncharacterized protein n=1 Tax=Choiromyces venosus 120613-1 TaxID=1336337 RepID=A0A3N4K6R1_9PEZI|nr:hypothetical protein L873DRAFT_1799578 [Choiromyces venosus 120613-1]
MNKQLSLRLRLIPPDHMPINSKPCYAKTMSLSNQLEKLKQRNVPPTASCGLLLLLLLLPQYSTVVFPAIVVTYPW